MKIFKVKFIYDNIEKEVYVADNNIQRVEKIANRYIDEMFKGGTIIKIDKKLERT